MAAPMSVTACPTKASRRASSIGFVSVVVMFLLPLVGFTAEACARTGQAASVAATETAESVAATDAFAAARAAPWSGIRRRGLTMIHPGIHAALTRERTSTFLAQAEAAGLAGQLIRPVRPADDGLLADGFAAELDHR